MFRGGSQATCRHGSLPIGRLERKKERYFPKQEDKKKKKSLGAGHRLPADRRIKRRRKVDDIAT